VIKRHTIVIISLIFIVLLQGCAPKLPIETNSTGEVADFSFMTQDEETFGKEDLQGDWWIADFIFTNCTTACLPMSSNMSILQNHIAQENLDVQLVSFSVDPDFDTPDVLREYGEQYNADFSNWHFLTGYDFKTIKNLSVKSFKAYLKEPDSNSDQFTHDTRFFLIDPEGNIVKGYSGLESANVEVIVDDLLTLQQADLINLK